MEATMDLEYQVEPEAVLIEIGLMYLHIRVTLSDPRGTRIYQPTVISRPFWQYSDPYSSPYFVPSQEPAFRPVSDLRMPYRTHPHLPTIFAFLVSL